MVKYCAFALCTNGSHNQPNLSYFRFPLDEKLRKKWKAFCRRADKKFNTVADPRICSQHFLKEDLKKTLSGKTEVISGGVPKIFDPKQPKAKSNLRKERQQKRHRQAQHSADNGTFHFLSAPPLWKARFRQVHFFPIQIPTPQFRVKLQFRHSSLG